MNSARTELEIFACWLVWDGNNVGHVFTHRGFLDRPGATERGGRTHRWREQISQTHPRRAAFSRRQNVAQPATRRGADLASGGEPGVPEQAGGAGLPGASAACGVRGESFQAHLQESDDLRF